MRAHLRVARIALAQARGELRVVSGYEKLPLLPPSTTDAAPGAWIKACARRIEGRPNVLTCLMSSRLESFPPRTNAAFWPLDPAVRHSR